MRLTDPQTGRRIVRKLRKRREELGVARELTFTCFRRFRFLERDRTRRWFLEALANSRSRWPVDLWAFVIMPDHVHLLIYPRACGVVSGFLKDLKEPVARNAIDHLKANHPEWLPRITVSEGARIRRRFWQPGGGYDRNICVDSTLHNVINYIHMNPVRKGLVLRCTDWPWSSAGWYEGESGSSIEMDRTLPTT